MVGFERRGGTLHCDGASLLVSSNGRGKIDVVEAMGTARPLPPPLPPQPFEKSRASAPAPAPVPPDRAALLERRIAELEAAMTRLATGGDLVERIAQLEQKMAPAMAQISRTLGTKEIAGPGLENRSVQTVARSAPAPRRITAIDAYAEGLRSELRTKAAAAAERARAEVERCDRAARPSCLLLGRLFQIHRAAHRIAQTTMTGTVKP